MLTGCAGLRISVWLRLDVLPDTLQLTLTDEDGQQASVQQPFAADKRQTALDAAANVAQICRQLSRLGTTHFVAGSADVVWAGGQFCSIFLPSSLLNTLRREAVAALAAARVTAFTRLPRAMPVDPPVSYVADALSYLANVFNQKAHDFYARHGVKVIAPAYEAIEEPGEVSLMITKHCVRFSLSLCPKQASPCNWSTAKKNSRCALTASRARCM